MLSVKNMGGAPAMTGTYVATSRGNSLDMGEEHTYRYVNTSSVPNSNSTTYTPNSNGSALDMGATNTYRYINTNTVYNLGKTGYSSLTKVAADGDYRSAHASASWVCTASTGLVIEIMQAEDTISSINTASGGTQVGLADYRNYGTTASYAPGLYMRIAKASYGTTYAVDCSTEGNLGAVIFYFN